MTVSNLQFLGLLIAGAIALIRYTSRSARQDPAAEPAPAQRVLADRGTVALSHHQDHSLQSFLRVPLTPVR